MIHAPVKSPPPRWAGAIVRRTRGRTHGPVTRLMSPSDFGEILKPFVFLDLFDHEGPPFNGPLHPPSGIATLTYVAEVDETEPGAHATARFSGVAGAPALELNAQTTEQAPDGPQPPSAERVLAPRLD